MILLLVLAADAVSAAIAGEDGRFHLVWIATDTDPRLKWIATHCSQISRRFYTCLPRDAG
jgi:hypothetical protein